MKAIFLLQTKLTDLERHKEEYTNNIDQWEKKKEAQQKKLTMTQDLLDKLEKERNKVLGNNFSVELNKVEKRFSHPRIFGDEKKS